MKSTVNDTVLVVTDVLRQVGCVFDESGILLNYKEFYKKLEDNGYSYVEDSEMEPYGSICVQYVDDSDCYFIGFTVLVNANEKEPLSLFVHHVVKIKEARSIEVKIVDADSWGTELIPLSTFFHYHDIEPLKILD